MANIYVRKSGNDSNDGSTPALAKLTIASAISAMASGDTVWVGAGIYREQNIDGGSKIIKIYGDTTGEQTGDAGEVIWSGLNSTDDSYMSSQYAITNTKQYSLDVQGFIFENWDFSNATVSRCACIYKQLDISGTYLIVKNCKARNIFANRLNAGLGIYFIYASSSPYQLNITIDNIDIDGIVLNGYTTLSTSYDATGIYVSNYGDWGSGKTKITNIKARNISCSVVQSSTSFTAYGNSCGIETYSANTGPVPIIKNVEISNIKSSCTKQAKAYGISLSTNYYGINNTIYNCICHDIFSVGYQPTSIGFYLGSTAASSVENCSAFNINAYGDITTENDYMTIYGSGLTKNNCVDKATYHIPLIDNISKFSPLKGQGNTIFPTTDINGNPRPAYGNGTACDIGAVESTSDIIQKESTIKDSGDYSVKVAPCNYFKKVFQVPVTASELRTVKVKIRIDGTWGTYLPRVSLSGQGMTLSQATKNSTTGSFEELTVSGTPTTNGIALLTIEAHSASTDAVFYIDTITIE